MKYTERDINLLIEDADRIVSAIERLDDKVLIGRSDEKDYTQDDITLEEISDDLHSGIGYIKEAVRKLKRILDVLNYYEGVVRVEGYATYGVRAESKEEAFKLIRQYLDDYFSPDDIELNEPELLEDNVVLTNSKTTDSIDIDFRKELEKLYPEDWE